MVAKIVFLKKFGNFCASFWWSQQIWGQLQKDVMSEFFLKFSFGSYVGLFHCKIFICWVHMVNDSHALLCRPIRCGCIWYCLLSTMWGRTQKSLLLYTTTLPITRIFCTKYRFSGLVSFTVGYLYFSLLYVLTIFNFLASTCFLIFLFSTGYLQYFRLQ